MADVIITAANVVPGANSVQELGIAGETLTQGQLVYRDTADSNKLKKVDSDSGTAIARTPWGIMLCGASNNQPAVVHRKGLITIGGTLTAGLLYVASDTAGGIMPAADLESGDYTSYVGTAVSSSVLDVLFHSSGAVV